MSHAISDILGQAHASEYTLRLLFAVSAVWLITGLAVVLLRRSSASLRHRLWSMSVATTLLLPTLMLILPERRVGAIRLEPQSVSIPVPGSAVMHATAPRAEADTAPRNENMTRADFAMHRIPPDERAAGTRLRSEMASYPSSSLPTAASVAGSPRARFNRRLVIWATWLMPMIWLVLRQILVLLSARALVRRATQIREEATVACAARLSNRLKVRAHPQLLATSELGTPVCLGLSRPRILLPTNWPTWPPAQMEAVLTHELAHVARRDVLWQFLARLACAVYWPHPFAWIAAWRMRVERELACDDWVLNGGESSTRYARCLLDVATALAGKPHTAELAGVAMASRTGLEKRVSAILDSHRARRPISRRWTWVLACAAVIVLAIAGTLSPLAPVSAQATASPAGAVNAPTARPTERIERPVKLSGRVENDIGQPVAGAAITIQVGMREYSARPAADGSFSVEVENGRGNYYVLRAADSSGKSQAYLQLESDSASKEIAGLKLVMRPAREFPVAVTDASGSPVGGATVIANAGYSVISQVTTDSSGKGSLRVPVDAPLMFVLARKSQVGMDYHLFWPKDAPHTNPYELEQNYSGNLKFVLNGAVTVKVRVVDEQDHPLAGVAVLPWLFEKPRKGGDANVAGMLLPQFKEETDQSGIVSFDSVPADQSQAITFWARLAGYSSPERWNYDPKSGNTEVVAKLLKQIHVTGRVMGSDGLPVGGAKVEVVGQSHREYAYFRNQTQSAPDGTFTLDVDREMYYAIVAQKDHQISAIVHQTIFKQPPADPIELKLAPATRVFGQATAGAGQSPLPNAYVGFSRRDDSYYQLPPEQTLPGNKAGGNAIQPSLGWNTKTDPQGNFETYVAPGKYNASVYAGAINIFQQTEISGAQLQVNLHSDQAPGASNLLKGRVVLKDQPATGVAEAAISGRAIDLDGAIYGVTADAQGNFVARQAKADMYVYAASPDRKLMGIVRVKPTDDQVTLPIGKTGSAHGRLVDSKGNALPAQEIEYGFRIATPDGTSTSVFGGHVKTDAAGGFVIDGLVPGYDYNMDAAMSFSDDGRANSWRGVGKAKVDAPLTIEIGDVILPDSPKQMAWKDYQATAFNEPSSLSERLAEAKITARLSYQNVMILLGSPGTPACDRFFEYREEPGQSQVWEAMCEHVLVALDTKQAGPELRDWMTKTNVQWPVAGMTIAILDMDGHLIGQATDAALSTDGKLDRVKLIDFSKKYALAKPDAQKLLDDALAQAGRENKNVLLDESGPYCPWCVKLSKYIEANQKLIDEDYVCVTLDRRFAHGKEILEKLHSKDFSTPWIAVLAPSGKPLSTSDSQGENFGYPVSADGRRQWEQMLQATRHRLTDAQIEQLIKALGA